ncbi:copper oxidase [Ammoniphilus oxalaticus]|uniref:Copper oxidase n=1 Tax=Ammoniphilus oxalaticus TaxID=66863 RepID=A0A419SRQ8_9BACL|nr:multicopper oxidase domain-containing protein [Ammoniphilus oxalaticus]RKD27133.1 copper oxidase [Ammoniphilus oxalaticus]
MKKMLFLILASALVLSACSAKTDGDVAEPEDHSMDGMAMGHDHHEPDLNHSTGENELKLPPILKSDKETEDEIHYTVDAQKGQTEIFDGYQTDTLGYNSSFLGPVLKVKKGQTVHINTKNSLDEDTTFHWHGLVIAGAADGGPHSVIKPGESKEITFKVDQGAATLWFHPHPLGNTAEQVFNGLAGLFYIEDDEADQLDLPNEYGKNDFPLIIQDKTFDEEKQLNFTEVKDEDGMMGDTLLVNGTVNPSLTIGKEKVRLRLLNGSNMRNYVFKLSNDQAFTQIASDGGLLNEPIELKELQLTPSERAEIVVDFSKLQDTDQLALLTGEDTVVLPFNVKEERTGGDNVNIPKQMNSIAVTDEEKSMKVTKEIVLDGMAEDVTINGKKLDIDRIDFTQKKGEVEVWEIYNKPDEMGGMIHPFHIHGTQFKVISINDELPPENLRGYKDTVSLDSGDRVKLAVRFDEPGIFMYHCHILEHEDNGMMGQVKVE